MVSTVGLQGPVGGGQFVNNPARAVASTSSTQQIDLQLQIVASSPAYFPADLLNGANGFLMALQWADFKRESITAIATLPPSPSMYLPIPDALTDAQGVVYSSTELGPAVGGAMEVAAAAGVGVKSAQDALNAMVNTSDVLGAVGAEIATQLASKAGLGNALQAGLSLGGLAINPFMIVLFQQPAFRSFSFTWKLAPANADESATLKKMLNTMRNNMLPGLSPSTKALMTYPKVVTPVIKPDIGVYFKPMVVENMSVAYAPGATPSFFRGTQQPTMVYLTLALKEIELWLANTYNAPSGTP